jgi:hypothetical protein
VHRARVGNATADAAFDQHGGFRKLYGAGDHRSAQGMPCRGVRILREQHVPD